MLDPNPAAWRLLGQGGAAAVFAYSGSVQELRHHVLRVPKAGPPPASALDAAVWADVPAVASAPDPAARDAAFAATVFAPLIGPQYVPPAVAVAIPPKLAAALSAAAATRLLPTAALLPDATAPLPGTSYALTIEFKPKSGWPHGGGRRPRALLQRQARRARAGGPLPPDPLDLFSGDTARVQRAIAGHLATNAAFFVDGVRVAALPPTSFGGRRGISAALAAILTAEPLLPSLLTAQHAPSCRHSHDAAAAADALQGQTNRAARAVAARALRAYLTATTARDVSVMVTLAEAEEADAMPRLQDSVTHGGCIRLPRRRAALAYRVIVVDVVAKPTAKIAAHVAADAALPRSLPKRGGGVERG